MYMILELLQEMHADYFSGCSMAVQMQVLL